MNAAEVNLQERNNEMRPVEIDESMFVPKRKYMRSNEWTYGVMERKVRSNRRGNSSHMRTKK